MYMYVYTFMLLSQQTDFANRDARAAFFARLEGGEHVGPPRSFPGPGIIILYTMFMFTSSPYLSPKPFCIHVHVNVKYMFMYTCMV